MNITLFDTIDSTNSYALRLIDGAASTEELLKLHKKVFVAKEQTAGRGRMNRPFYSPEKTGIYFSMIYVPEAGVSGDENALGDGHGAAGESGVRGASGFSSESGVRGASCVRGDFSPAVYTATAGVCVCRVLEKLFGVKCFIKWVNDIYIEDKKVCGILTEGRFDASRGCISAFVVGIGINLVTSNFPEEIKNRAGRVLKNSSELKEEIYTSLPTQVFKEFLQIVDEQSADLPNASCASKEAGLPNASCASKRADLPNASGSSKGANPPNASGSSKLAASMAEYKARSNLMGKTVFVSPVINSGEGVYEALVTGITDNALLEVQLSDGSTRILDSGEVSIKM